MRFDEKFIEELKTKLNIVDVVGGYCNLQKKGGSYWACCPLPGHSERTPSFSVNESGQFYKCFGCGKGGDVIKFIMEMENLDFSEAVKFLCEKARIPLPEPDGKDEEVSRRKMEDKERLYALLRETAFYYVGALKSPACANHRAYVKKRGLESVVRPFGIGASPDFDGLPKYLRQKGYTDEEMLAAGVCQRSAKTQKIFDAEAERLIFPVIDHMNRVLAFGGRALEVKNGFAKYKNTAETVIFNKRRVLYNINVVKKERAEKGALPFVIVVEGYMDTVALYKAGYRNVVASMGTSLTIEQARVIKRYSDVAVICYDGDGAGQKATIRGLEILAENGLEVRVVSLPDNLDPDEIIAQRGKAAYDECLKNALPLIDFKLKLVRDNADVSTVSGRRDYVNKSLQVIRECKDAALQEDLLKKLRDESGITFDALKRDLEKGEVSIDPPEFVTPLEKEEQSRPLPDKKTVEAERFVLASFIENQPYTKNCSPADFDYSSEERKLIADIVATEKMLGHTIEPERLQNFVGEDNLGELGETLNGLDKFPTAAREKMFNDCFKKVARKKINRQIDELTKQASLEENKRDVEKSREIAMQLQQALTKLKELNS